MLDYFQKLKVIMTKSIDLLHVGFLFDILHIISKRDSIDRRIPMTTNVIDGTNSELAALSKKFLFSFYYKYVMFII